MNFNIKSNKKLAKWIIGIISVCIIVYIALNNIPGIFDTLSYIVSLLAPIIIGVSFAMIINVPMRFFEGLLFGKSQKASLIKLRRPLAFIIALSLIIGVIVGVVWLIIPELTDAVNVIIKAIDDIIAKTENMEKSELEKHPIGSLLLKLDVDSIIDSFENWFKASGTSIFNTAYGTVSSIIGAVYNLIIGFVFSVYFLFGKEKLKLTSKRIIDAWLPKKLGNTIKRFISLFSKNFGSFISGQTIEALILGSLCAIGMLILQIPYVPMVSALVGVLSMIPVIGGFTGAVIGTFMILTVDPVKALIFLVFLLILQQFEGNIIYPRVMGSRVNLSGMWILCAVVIGGGIAGPVGILLGVPVISTLYVMIKQATVNREKQKEVNEYASEESTIILDEED